MLAGILARRPLLDETIHSHRAGVPMPASVGVGRCADRRVDGKIHRADVPMAASAGVGRCADKQPLIDGNNP